MTKTKNAPKIAICDGNGAPLTPAQICGQEKISGYLDLSGLTSIPAGFNPTVGGSLYLSGLTSIPAGFNPTVGGSLYLSGLTSIPAGFNPTVGGSLDLRGLTSIPAGFNPTVGGGLYLSGLTSIPAGFNPTVGGGLYLRGLTSIPAGFNPTVGGSLDLRGLTSIPAGFNPTVGGGLYLSGLTKPPQKTRKNPPVYPLTWRSGRFLMVDGILTEVIRRRGMTYRVKKVGHHQISYLVNNGDLWSHGATLAEARADLIYKHKGTDTSAYKKLTLTSKLTFTEAIACYRGITGACSTGVRWFVEDNNVKQTSVTIAQIIKMTKGKYGGDVFAQFFSDAKKGKK